MHAAAIEAVALMCFNVSKSLLAGSSHRDNNDVCDSLACVRVAEVCVRVAEVWSARPSKTNLASVSLRPTQRQRGWGLWEELEGCCRFDLGECGSCSLGNDRKR